MKLSFTIHYRTEWGQQLAVLLSYIQQDGSQRKARVPMLTEDGDFWTAETAAVESRRSGIASFVYHYVVEDAEGHVLRSEWNGVARSYAFDPTKSYKMADRWRDLPLNAHLYTSAYQVTALLSGSQAENGVLKLPLFRKTVLFRVSAPQLVDGQSLAIVGSHPALGSWNPVRYLPMESVGQGDWMLSLNVDWLGLPLEYKYVVIDKQKHELVAWEEGDNRTVPDELSDGEVYITYGEPLRLAEKMWRKAGVCVPVFALRSEQSCGVGDFGDLYQFIDWAAQVGLKVVQLLPVNDTTLTHRWGDSYPYNIMSAFDLHPHYIDLNQLGPLKDKRRMTAFRRQQSELNALGYSDYEAVDRVKMEYLKDYYHDYIASTPARDQDDASAGDKDDEAFHDFVQQHLHQQLKRAADHARELGVVLMGDLPIGVCRESKEVMQHPDFFNLDSQTGAPPDTFARQGQNWGFPTYNWEAEGISEWMDRRFLWMEQYFDALRIDHVLGFFRIWEIPNEQLSGYMGHFSPALPLTAGEIEYFGLPFRRDFLTRPFINDRVIERLFGIHAQYVKDSFLIKKAYGLYELKDEVATQRRVQQLFEGKGDENSLWIRDGLYRLVGNILFLEDPRQPEMYHPRIQAWQEPVFDMLSAEEKDAFMRIYNNFYYQRHSMFWGKTGYDRLSRMMSNTHMLLCAEDLGMLPDCVEPVLDSLRILTLEIQQMPKQTGEEFSHLDGNPVRSVATITTHDMAPLRLWWQENPERTQRYYTTMLQKQGRAPEQLPAHLAEEIIARHIYSPSMLCILSLQDWLAMDGELRAKNPREERINVPSDPYNRWQWRMHLTIEQLQQAEHYNKKLKTMIARSKR
ncbi:MAG: 4-alpha-glucanotransferase [Prevotella sp.]|nr:4-alpha-glucanotransferase [Prevotella sp.]